MSTACPSCHDDAVAVTGTWWYELYWWSCVLAGPGLLYFVAWSLFQVVAPWMAMTLTALITVAALAWVQREWNRSKHAHWCKACKTRWSPQ